VPAYTLLHISKPFNKTEGTENCVTVRMTGDLNCNTITNKNYENAEVQVPPSSGFPNCPWPQLPASHFSQLQLSTDSTTPELLVLVI
jgi:hypothetical protein